MDRPGWIQTASGRKFWPLDPHPADVDIFDIGCALGNICRFTGHTRQFYSVAQHSVLASWYVAEPRDALWALLHDASEAYLCDIARPVKRTDTFAGYREAETRLMAAICRRFGLPLVMPAAVHVIDRRLFVTERRDLMAPLRAGDAEAGWDDVEPLLTRIEPWTPALAQVKFLARYDELTRGSTLPSVYAAEVPHDAR